MDFFSVRENNIEQHVESPRKFKDRFLRKMGFFAKTWSNPYYAKNGDFVNFPNQKMDSSNVKSSKN